MNIDELESVARAIVARQKGVLAADESSPTIKKRFDVDQRRIDRGESAALPRDSCSPPTGSSRRIGGVILFDETLRQSTRDGAPFPKLLASRGIVPGIKVDKGAKALALYPGDKVTEGLDGLRERLAEYRQLGARFAKWRAVIDIDERDIPTAFGDPCQCPRAGALRRAVPGSGPGADRRARSADGRRSRHRALRSR